MFIVSESPASCPGEPDAGLASHCTSAAQAESSRGCLLSNGCVPIHKRCANVIRQWSRGLICRSEPETESSASVQSINPQRMFLDSPSYPPNPVGLINGDGLFGRWWPGPRPPLRSNRADLSSNGRMPDFRAIVAATTVQSLARESLLASLRRVGRLQRGPHGQNRKRELLPRRRSPAATHVAVDDKTS